MEPSTWVTIVLGAIASLNFWWLYVLTQKNKKIELLEQKNDIQDQTIRKQEIANVKLEITGQLARMFFKELPKVGGNDEESG